MIAMLKNKFAMPAAAVLALAAAWPLTVNAANNTSVEVVEIAAEQSASEVIQALADQALADLTDQTLSDDVRRKKFVALMDRYFEMDVVSRFVLGRYWRSISQEKIIDVSIEGLSMGITQRDEFTSVIQQNGDDVSALTKALKAKTGL